jgi:ribosome biogenesis protein ENP2
MQVTNTSGTKVYRITTGKNLPQWLSANSKKALKKDFDFQRRIEVIQDFEFPVATQRLKLTKDRQHMIAIGTYKPRIRVWDLNELSMKFERHIDCEAVQFLSIENDWRKLILLHANRYIEFQTANGPYYKTRVPRICTDMTYEERTCDLFVVGASSDVYRLNLEQGRFLQPFESAGESINVCTTNPVFSLVATGMILLSRYYFVFILFFYFLSLSFIHFLFFHSYDVITHHTSHITHPSLITYLITSHI